MDSVVSWIVLCILTIISVLCILHKVEVTEQKHNVTTSTHFNTLMR